MGAPGCPCFGCRRQRSTWRTVGLVLLAVVAFLCTGIVFAHDVAAPATPEPPAEWIALLAILAIVTAHVLVILLNWIARRLDKTSSSSP